MGQPNRRSFILQACFSSGGHHCCVQASRKRKYQPSHKRRDLHDQAFDHGYMHRRDGGREKQEEDIYGD